MEPSSIILGCKEEPLPLPPGHKLVGSKSLCTVTGCPVKDVDFGAAKHCAQIPNTKLLPTSVRRIMSTDGFSHPAALSDLCWFC